MHHEATRGYGPAQKRGSDTQSDAVDTGTRCVADGGIKRTATLTISDHTKEGASLYSAVVDLVEAKVEKAIDGAVIIPTNVGIEGDDVDDFVEADLDLGAGVSTELIHISVADDDARDAVFATASQAVADHYHDVLAEGASFNVEWVSYRRQSERWSVRIRFADDQSATVVTDGGHVKLGTVTGGSILDADGEAILVLQGTDGIASVRVPEEMVAPVNGLVEEVARHYNLDIPETMPDGGTVPVEKAWGGRD